MKRSCLLSLLLFGGLFGGAWYYFHPLFYPPADWIGALVFALFTSMAIGSAWNAFHDSSDAAVLARQDQPRQDGQRVAATGPIHPIGQPLLAPLSQTPCVAYEYELFHYGRDSQGHSSKVKDRTGLALTPSVIRTRNGSVKLLGYPMLDAFPARSNDKWRENAAQYLASSPSEQIQITQVFSLVKELLTDDDGQIRKDWRLTDSTDFDRMDIEEKVLEVGQTVTIFGKYSAEKGGIVQDLGQGGLRIIKGDQNAAVASLRGGRSRGLILAVLMLTIPNAILWLVLQRREHYNTEKGYHSIQVDRKSAFFDSVKGGDGPAVAKYLAEGGNVDVTDDEGKTALMMAADPGVARTLIEARANVNAADSKGMTPLMTAATAGNAGIVRLLIDSRASLDLEDPEYHRTALQYAFDNDHPDVVKLLHDAGAHDDNVTAENGRALPSDGGDPFAAVAGYFKAIHTADAEKVKPFVKKANQHYWDEKPTWDAIQGAHPADPHFDSGFVGDGKATVTVSGQTADGLNQTWIMQLIREDGTWRVGDEHWAGINK